MVAAMQGRRVVIGVRLFLSPLVNGMNPAPRVVPAILNQRPNNDDVIADLRHAKRIVKGLTRGLGNLQGHRVRADDLHHEGPVLILTVSVIQNVLEGRIESESDVRVPVPCSKHVFDRAATVKHGAMIFRRSGRYTWGQNVWLPFWHTGEVDERDTPRTPRDATRRTMKRFI